MFDLQPHPEYGRIAGELSWEPRAFWLGFAAYWGLVVALVLGTVAPALGLIGAAAGLVLAAMAAESIFALRRDRVAGFRVAGMALLLFVLVLRDMRTPFPDGVVLVGGLGLTAAAMMMVLFASVVDQAQRRLDNA